MSKLSKLSNEFKRNIILFYYTVLSHVFTISIFGSLGVGTMWTTLMHTLLTLTGIWMYKKISSAMFLYKLSNWIMLICSALAISKGPNVLNGYGPSIMLPNAILFIVAIITFVLHLYGIIITKSLKKNYFNAKKEKTVNKTNGKIKGEIPHVSETTEVAETPSTDDSKERTKKKEIKNVKKEKKKRKQGLQTYIEITLILLGSFCLPNLYKTFALLFVETWDIESLVMTMVITILGLFCSFTGLLLLKKTKLGYIITMTINISLLTCESLMFLCTLFSSILSIINSMELGTIFIPIFIGAWVFARIVSTLHLRKIKNKVYFNKEREEKNRKSTKQIIALFGIVLLIITLLIAAVGLPGYKIVKFVDMTQEQISQNSMEFNEIIDNTVNKENKKTFYENFDVKTIKKHGNTIMASADNTYIMKYINDEDYVSCEVKNQYINTGEKVNYGMYAIKTNEEIKTIGNIQVVKDNKMKDYWFTLGGEEAKNVMPVNDANMLFDMAYDVIESTDGLEYIHTSKDGIDTVKCINSANIEIILKIDPKTAELHYYQLEIGSSNTAMLFTETDISTIDVPDSLIKSTLQIRCLTEKYIKALYQDVY